MQQILQPRAQRIKARMRHVARSAQSSQARKAVTLAQGVMARGPSTARITSAADTSDGCAASRCPPAGPRRLSSRPWSRSCVRIASRNLRGTSAASAKAEALVQPLADFNSASTRVARRAYFARLVSTLWLSTSEKNGSHIPTNVMGIRGLSRLRHPPPGRAVFRRSTQGNEHNGVSRHR
jgi:hypothetical protein